MSALRDSLIGKVDAVMRKENRQVEHAPEFLFLIRLRFDSSLARAGFPQTLKSSFCKQHGGRSGGVWVVGAPCRELTVKLADEEISKEAGGHAADPEEFV